MPEILTSVWIAAQVVIGYNLIFPLLLYGLYLVSKKNRLTASSSIPPTDYAIIITAYQYTNTLPAVVSSVLKLNYENYLVYVVADNCDVSGLDFNDSRVILLRPEEVLKGNVKSHFYAINRFKRNHDVLTIIDSDNIVHPEYLNNLNIYFNKGFKAVQGIREAKNLDTTYACLDAARDIYYHYYDGKILFEAGSSATLSGSGMAFTTQLYKDCLENTSISGAGFDKVLQAAIVGRNERIAFAADAIVYDEKTSKSDQLVNQRARWINTWFKYFKFGFYLIFKGVGNLSLNQFLFGAVLLRPPLFLFLVLSVLMMIVNLFTAPAVALVWLGAFVLFIIGFIKAIVTSNPDKRIYKALVGIPRFMFYQIVSLTKIYNANKRSVTTRHFHDKEIDPLK